MNKKAFLIGAILLCFECSSKLDRESPKIDKSEPGLPGKKVCLILADLEEGILAKVGSKACSETAPAMYVFQPVLALAALESGSLKDAHSHSVWDKTKYPYIRWQKDQNLKSALENSSVWYFENLWKDLGAGKLKAWLSKVGLPNSVSSDPNRTFWMDGGYVWTAEEFFLFLGKLFSKDLEVRSKNVGTILEGLNRVPGEVKNPTGSHILSGNWERTGTFYSDSGTGYAGERSVSWYWFYWKKERKALLFLSRVESASETLFPLEAASFGVDYMRDNGLWEKYFSD